MATLTQTGRFLQVFSPLDADALLVRSVTGRDAISEEFEYEVELASESFAINAAELIGQPMTVRAMLTDGGSRSINGRVAQFTLLPTPDKYARYRATLLPWFSMLKHTTDCRIWQDKDVIEIVTGIFTDLELKDFRNETVGTFEKREYCVQYNESTYNFVRRLLEDEGIAHYYRHEDTKHTLVLANSPSGFHDCPQHSTFHWERAGNAGFMEGRDVIREWTRTWRPGTSNYAQADYNFKTPSTSLQVTVPTTSQFKVPASTRYEFPGGFNTVDEGDSLSKLRMEAVESISDVCEGSGTARSMLAGHKFTLAEHPRREQNGKYLLLETRMSASQGSFHGGENAGEDRYDNSFLCIPAAIPFRPQITTAKPVIYGPQTAFVTGPAGEEIYVDMFGRIKVQFHWDRYGAANETSSCWIRVAQPVAGKGWGTLQIPRIGQEVVVSFLGGDPDLPVVTGSVYNAESMPPYTLPDFATRSGMKSLSSKGGGGYNEIRLDDSKDSEMLFINAQKYMDTRVGEDRKTYIKKDDHLIVDQNTFTKVGGDAHYALTGDQNNKINGTASYSVSMDWQQKVGMKYALDSGMEVHLKAGMNVVIEAGVSLTLKVGGNFVNISPAGVAITGTMVLINSGGAPGSGSGASPKSPTAPKEPIESEGGKSDKAMTRPKQPAKPKYPSPQAVKISAAAQHGDATAPAGS